MAWCEPCSRFFNPGSVDAGGNCPDCGAELETASEGAAQASPGGDAEGDALPKVPWHFWVGVGAMVLYLGWRLIEGIVWALG